MMERCGNEVEVDLPLDGEWTDVAGTQLAAGQ